MERSALYSLKCIFISCRDLLSLYIIFLSNLPSVDLQNTSSTNTVRLTAWFLTKQLTSQTKNYNNRFMKFIYLTIFPSSRSNWVNITVEWLLENAITQTLRYQGWAKPSRKLHMLRISFQYMVLFLPYQDSWSQNQDEEMETVLLTITTADKNPYSQILTLCYPWRLSSMKNKTSPGWHNNNSLTWKLRLSCSHFGILMLLRDNKLKRELLS